LNVTGSFVRFRNMQKGNEETPDHILNGVCTSIPRISKYLLYQSHHMVRNCSLRVRNFVLVDNQCKARDNRNQNRTDHLFNRRNVGRIDRGDDGKADKTLINRHYAIPKFSKAVYARDSGNA
jgi:hypothetical protein